MLKQLYICLFLVSYVQMMSICNLYMFDYMKELM